MSDERNTKTDFVYRPVITLGTLLVIVSMGIGLAGTLITVVWQAGTLRATLEDSIQAEHLLRETENKAITASLAEVRSDVRDLRTVILNTRAAPPGP